MIAHRGRRTRATTVRGATAALALVALVATAGCGSGSGTGAAAPSLSGDAAAPGAAAPAALLGYRVSVKDLPDGWRDSQARSAGYRLTVCGVDIEPQPPVQTDALRFAQSAIGPFVEQYIRAYDGTAAATVVDGLHAALPRCTQYTATNEDTGETARFTVAPLVVKGLAAGDVAWRQTSVNDHPITADYVMTRRGGTVVLLAAYALTGPPPPGALDAAYAAVRAKP